VLLDLLRLPPLLQVHTCYGLYDTDTLLTHLGFQGLGNPRWSHFIDNQFNQFQFPQLVGISYMPIERFQFTIFSNSIQHGQNIFMKRRGRKREQTTWRLQSKVLFADAKCQ